MTKLLTHHLLETKEPDSFLWGVWIWDHCFKPEAILHVKNLEVTQDFDGLHRMFVRGLANYQASPATRKKVEQGRQDMLKHMRFIEAIGLESFGDFMLRGLHRTTLAQTRQVYEYLQLLPAGYNSMYDPSDVLYRPVATMNYAKRRRVKEVLCCS